METTRRLEYIDFARGIGILLVVLGHYVATKSVLLFIFAFHMPLFMFLSGMVFKNLKNVKNLLAASVVGSIIGSIVYIAMERSASSVLQSMLGIIGGSAAPHYKLELNSAVWFFSALIIIQVLYFFSSKYHLEFLLVIILPIIGMLLKPMKSSSWIPWNADVALFLYPFFVAGCKTKILAQKLKKQWNSGLVLMFGVLCLLCVVPLSKLNGSVNIYRLAYGKNIFLYYLNGALGIAGILLISYFVAEKLHAVAKVSELIETIGKHTIVVVSYHQILIALCLAILSTYFTEGSVLFAVVKTAMYFAMVCVLVVIDIYASRKMPWLVGKINFKSGN